MKRLDKEVRETYEDICARSFSRMCGNRIEDVSLRQIEPESFGGSTAKSSVYAFNVSLRGNDEIGSVEGMPGRVVIKQYNEDTIGVSEKNIAINDFEKERILLSKDISIGENGDEIRIYPALYSKNTEEANKNLILVREYIPGENLAKVVRKKGENINWEAEPGEEFPIGNSLFPISLLHLNSSSLERELLNSNLDLLEYSSEDNEISDKVSNNRGINYSKYIETLIDGRGLSFSNRDKGKVREAAKKLDEKYVSRDSLIGIIDGELDVFPHHAMENSLIDAGGVEVGSILRDLAVYGDPVFEKLWEKRNMPETVLSSYQKVRNRLEERLHYEITDFNIEELIPGLLLASSFGNLRTAAAKVHYRDSNEKDRESIEEGVSSYISNSKKYLKRFKELGDVTRSDKKMVDNLLGFLDKKGLTDQYKLGVVNTGSTCSEAFKNEGAHV